MNGEVVELIPIEGEEINREVARLEQEVREHGLEVSRFAVDLIGWTDRFSNSYKTSVLDLEVVASEFNYARDVEKRLTSIVEQLKEIREIIEGPLG